MIEEVTQHIPVLLKETLHYLQVSPGGIYVDCTVGMGGHAREILKSLSGQGLLVALDRDRESLEAARRNLGQEFPHLSLYHENYKNLPLVLRNLGIEKIDGCLVDLGISSFQLSSPDRGFSFQQDAPLDMRMDTGQRTTAADLVNQLPEERLVEIFRTYGEEPSARRIAAAIIERRQRSKFQTTTELAELVETVKGGRRGSRIHPATQVFQALRIEVNQELQGLDNFLSEVLKLIHPGGRLVVISFHSLEDRIVKRNFQLAAGRCICFRPSHLCTCPRIATVLILTRKPITPSPEETDRNPRARSAKLRAVERIQ